MSKKPIILGHRRAWDKADWSEWDPLELLQQAAQDIGPPGDTRNVDILVVAWRVANGKQTEVNWSVYSLEDRDTMIGFLSRVTHAILRGGGDGKA